MRFLQIATFYPQYLTGFYRARPGLASRSYMEQFSTLLADGFNCAHMLAPDMTPLGYASTLIIANALSLQQAWAREHGFPIPAVEADLPSLVRAQIRHYQPDILYLLDSITHDARFLATVDWQPSLILGWRAATIPVGTDWRGFDILLSSDAGCRATALVLGARRSAYFLPGIPVGHAASLGPAAAGKPDIIFCGHLTREHAGRVSMLDAVAKEAQRQGWCMRIHAAAPGVVLPPVLADMLAPPLFGIDMYRALRDASVCLNNHIDVLGGRGQNMRVFEATGSGACLLTEEDPDLSALFVAGREVATFQSDEELLEQITWYLDHSQARDLLARQGLERCQRDHGRPGRARWLDRLIRDAMR
ncbi:glycosyltransferase family protein [Niveispirillum fermenti]|uniref:glycosyltransferase family protein n=1 Tax=Niveispirillum fermenti TaxID=1233113 RepID=UPI003A8353EE